MILQKSNTIFREDSAGRKFRYEVESVARKIGNMLGMTVKESNWGRITQHIDDGCMMISACRGDKSEAENTKRTDNLAKDLREYKLGYIRILGGYIENKDTPDEVEVTEESFFVPKPKDMDDDEFFDVAIKLCKRYDQDSVLISLPDYTKFGYYDKKGNFDFSPGEKFIANDKQIGQYFSALVKGARRNKKFAFDDPVQTEWLATRHPASHSQAVLMSKNGEYF